MAPILVSANQTRHLLVVEEGTITLGWGAEILARTTEKLGTRLLSSNRIGAIDSPIPASSVLESAMLPDIDGIIAAARSMV
jgi:pyruvate dehydrogenase E1 component beta subunit